MERENERGNPSHTCREGNQCIGEVIHVFSEVTQHLGIHSEAIKKKPTLYITRVIFSIKFPNEFLKMQSDKIFVHYRILKRKLTKT